MLAAAPYPAERGDEWPRGQLIEQVVCQDDPTESYALYLPSSYAPAQRWPIIYALDARSRALVPAELLREGAERYGFIVASSYGSRSDEDADPTVKALGAMWRDTHARFALDERRAYAAGFSGAARTVCKMADAAPGSLAGVIACGAGFATDRPPRAGLAFSVFGIAGEADFNYQELQVLDETLEALGVPHRTESFDGPHRWPAAGLLSGALAWLEVRGMREDRRPRDPELAAALLARWGDEAAALEKSGNAFEAHRRYAGLVRDFAGLADVAAARAAAGRVAASRAYERERRSRLEWRRLEQEYAARAPGILSRLGTEDAPYSLQLVLSELRIGELRRRAEHGDDRAGRLSARRSLELLSIQTGFYQPRTLRQRGEPARAALMLAVATEIHPEQPYVWYDLACARAQAGSKRDALRALERAVESGFKDGARIESEADLVPLRDEAGFRALITRLAPGAEPVAPR